MVPADVGAVSVHGTGTQLGDPIEVGALGQDLGSPGGRTPLTLLSNKSCFGHTEGAAGGYPRRFVACTWFAYMMMWQKGIMESQQDHTQYYSVRT